MAGRKMTSRMLFALLTIATLMGEAAAAAAIAPYGSDRDADLARPLDQTARPPARPAAALAPDRTLSGNPLWAIPLRQLPATRERPLFTPSRRPPPPVVANARPVPQP